MLTCKRPSIARQVISPMRSNWRVANGVSSVSSAVPPKPSPKKCFAPNRSESCPPAQRNTRTKCSSFECWFTFVWASKQTSLRIRHMRIHVLVYENRTHQECRQTCNPRKTSRSQDLFESQSIRTHPVFSRSNQNEIT